MIDDTLVRKYTYDTLEFCVSCGQANDKNDIHCSQCGTQMMSMSAKNKVGQIIDQSLTAIPELTRNVDFGKSKATAKQLSKEHTAYIKRTPIILLPAAISIVIMLLFSAFIVQQFNDDLAMMGDWIDIEELNVFDAAALSESLSDELGIDVNIPELPMFTMVLATVHNIDFTFSAQMFENSNQYRVQMKESNIFLGLFIIPIIALCIGAIVYGVMAKKRQWPFWRGVMYSVVLYTLFVVIVSLFARYKAKASGVDSYGDAISVTVKLVPSIIDGIISAGILSSFVFTIVAYVVYAGRNLKQQLEQEIVYVKYVLYGLAVTAIGMFVQFVNAIIALKSSASEAASDFFAYMIMEQIPSSTYYIIAMYTAVANWYLTLFGKINIKEDREDTAYTWFFNDDISALTKETLIESTTFMPPLLLVILTFALFVAVGYMLTNYNVISFKEAAIVAIIFAAIQVVLLYVVNMQVEIIKDRDGESVTIAVSIIRQLLTTVLFTFAAIYAGSYGKIKWRHNV